MIGWGRRTAPHFRPPSMRRGGVRLALWSLLVLVFLVVWLVGRLEEERQGLELFKARLEALRSREANLQEEFATLQKDAGEGAERVRLARRLLDGRPSFSSLVEALSARLRPGVQVVEWSYEAEGDFRLRLIGPSLKALSEQLLALADIPPYRRLPTFDRIRRTDDGRFEFEARWTAVSGSPEKPTFGTEGPPSGKEGKTGVSAVDGP